jgi:catechol 2,3-dioxygenase-like lactoylglutathione lyase family enzyme
MAEFTGLGALGQVSRSVTDIGAAEAFYRDLLGIRHLFTFGDLAFFDMGGVRLFLSATKGAGDGAAILYFRVPDIDAAQGVLAARGVVFRDVPHMIHRHADGSEEWMTFFDDNEGRPLALMATVEVA